MSHEDHTHHQSPEAPAESPPRLATSATLHCLLGCGLGEVFGDTLGTILNLSNPATITLGLAAGLAGGFALGVRPYRARGIAWAMAARRVAITEGLSIVVMEATEAAVELLVPGLMAATVLQPFYWFGMVLALIAGFSAAWPVNFFLARRGIRHQH